MRSRWITGGDSCTAVSQNCGDACGKREPEKEKPVQAEEVLDRQIRPVSQSCDADRNRVEKPVSHVPRKAAIDYTVPVP